MILILMVSHSTLQNQISGGFSEHLRAAFLALVVRAGKPVSTAFECTVQLSSTLLHRDRRADISWAFQDFLSSPEDVVEAGGIT